jgi:hypothetical protein
MSINGFIVYRDNKFWIEVVDMCPWSQHVLLQPPIPWGPALPHVLETHGNLEPFLQAPSAILQVPNYLYKSFVLLKICFLWWNAEWSSHMSFSVCLCSVSRSENKQENSFRKKILQVTYKEHRTVLVLAKPSLEPRSLFSYSVFCVSSDFKEGGLSRPVCWSCDHPISS